MQTIESSMIVSINLEVTVETDKPVAQDIQDNILDQVATLIERDMERLEIKGRIEDLAWGVSKLSVEDVD